MKKEKKVSKAKDVKKIALITAAGVGSRVGQDIPKQFLNVYDKPIIMYTLDCFQKHPEIDAIVVVCLKGWENVLEAYIKQFNIDKVVDIVPGGETGFESIIRGTNAIKKKFKGEDIVVVHDGTRASLSADIISNNLAICIEKGNAITAIPCVEALAYSEEGNESTKEISRDYVYRTQTPHSFRLKDLCEMHKEAKKQGITNVVAMCSLKVRLGGKIYFSPGSEKNFKITTLDDIEMFKALLKAEMPDWIKVTRGK
jgi:2-C-methyl-D-erythritol 4-phosphate cytidylyltransferase